MCNNRIPIPSLADEHQEICSHPRKSGAEVMSAIQSQHTHFVEEKKFYSQLVDLLSYEKIIFSDLQMKPYRTDEVRVLASHRNYVDGS